MKGILFTPENIVATVEGRKTNTRRAEAGLKQLNKNPDAWECKMLDKGILACRQQITYPGGFYLSDWVHIKPRYKIGEIVYIKEAWATSREFDALASNQLNSEVPLYYKLDYPEPLGDWNDPEVGVPFIGRWRSPLHLREDFARYLLKILSIGGGRLQEITEEDAVGEGFRVLPGITKSGVVGLMSARACFKELWDSINKAYPWKFNPWVFAYGFEQVKG